MPINDDVLCIINLLSNPPLMIKVSNTPLMIKVSNAH